MLGVEENGEYRESDACQISHNCVNPQYGVINNLKITFRNDIISSITDPMTLYMLYLNHAQATYKSTLLLTLKHYSLIFSLQGQSRTNSSNILKA